MSAHFCPDCKRILSIKTEKGKKHSACFCGFKTDIISEISVSESLKQPEKKGQGIASEEKNLKGFPHDCSKCGYGEAEVTDLGAFYGDESNIVLFKCKKCNHTDRVTDGASNLR